ncbi:putative glyoxalase protein [Azorhizobium caulinodans ORS 571]|uniref:Putative glyoxalase protein n=1 Tax=Azorhizobium caulinodans (strain ATCC 43989 / DSM 5975 / JCM 20966 / LMG 6465 / NBRC 14845 / NCIMB 13405 / ORS 571) TaxID=438753 RepID=A8I1Z2_AZOC5|nr:VOC family protein [Azorhizobium caulinodans]BAF90679.1 putative glyoxalase protein [Azorhizobium caulinodans ORS 571]
MTYSNMILLYVSDPAASARFYGRLFGRAPVEQSQTFVLFVLSSGLRVGLWGRGGVAPAPTALPGASEIGFNVKEIEAVDATHADWVRRGAQIALPPTDLDFGRSFVAVDPDGHRLRVYAFAEGSLPVEA